MKPIKVFFYGKRLRDVYPFATPRQVFFWKVQKYCRAFFRIAGISIVLTVAVVSGSLIFPNVIYSIKEVPVDILPMRIDELKNEVVAKLEKCESGGRKEEDGIVVLDSNDRGSYGVMQWQRKSVMYYYELKTGNPINGRDAIILALTADKARDLAKWVIFETESGVEKDWYNCSKKHGLQTEVDLIKKLAR